MAGESKRSRDAIDSKGCNGVGSLIAGVKEISRRIDAKAARIVTANPLFTAEAERTRRTDGKPGDGVVQPVGCIQEFPAGGDQNLRSVIRTRKALGQAGHGLLLRKRSLRRVIVVADQGRGLFLK